MREVDGDEALRRAGDDEHVREPEQRDEHEQRLAPLAVLLRLRGIRRAQLRDQYLSNSTEKKSHSSLRTQVSRRQKGGGIDRPFSPASALFMSPYKMTGQTFLKRKSDLD